MITPAAPVALLMGTFHFSNPGKDLVRAEVRDVMSDGSQRYLEALSQKLAGYRPTCILLEFDEAKDAEVNERYNRYRDAAHVLTTDEVEQLGFRIAHKAGLSRVHGFDERTVRWESEKLFAQLSREPDLEKQFAQKVREFANEEAEAQSSLTLQDLLKRHNSPSLDQLNKSMYVLTNAAGADQNFAGAEASASWWHRNFRMFARIQKHAHPDARLIVIGGQGHIAIFRDLLRLDPRLRAEDISRYL